MRSAATLSICMTLLVAIAGNPSRAEAQTSDQARLSLGVFGGWIGPRTIWAVPNQPILSSEPGLYDPDVYSLRREVRSDITLGGHFTYFSSPHVGFTGEFTYLGLGATDSCQLTQDGGDPELRDACTAIAGQQQSASVTTVQGGLIIRPLAHSTLQPYIKGMFGMAFTPSSMIHMESIYGFIADTLVALTVYNDDSYSPIRPSWTGALGIETAPSSGYQIRVEVRDTWLPISEVTGATSGQGYVPPHRTTIRSFPSVLVGFDVVLQKTRGRRY
ncbi:MAG TPA: hypothetical protein VGM77_01605 [Gemmatimonadales bacterium]